MPNAIETERLERITPAVEVELAVIRTSFATKDDVQRILNLLYEHKLEIFAALSKQREDFYAALTQVQIDLHKTLIGHVWKLYVLASLVLGGVYYIARYVH